MIGLVDYDLYSSTSVHLAPPNIEIMKLATYYKTEENKFCRLLHLDETELTPYDKIFVFSEAEVQPQLPEPFLRASNIIYGGTAFTNGVYIPFKNEIIDYTIPRASIYKQFLKEKDLLGINPKIINHILDDTYYRMYAGANRLPIPPILPNKRVFIYDKDFFVQDWQKIIETISDKHPSGIKPIHPVICKTVAQYFQLREQSRIIRDIDIILDFNIPLDETPQLMKKYKNKFLETILPSSNVFITLGGTYETQYQYQNDFIYKLNLLYVYWSNGIPLKIKYLTPKIGHNNSLANISKLVETWTTGKTNLTKTINDRIPKDKKISEVRPERAERNKLLEKFPSAKTLFFQTRTSVEKGGFWKYGY